MPRSFLLYVGCIGFAFGIFTRSLFLYGLPEILCVAVVCVGLVVVWRKKSGAFFAPYLFYSIIFLTLFALGSFRMEMASWSEVDSLLQSQVGTVASFEGVVIREPDIREKTQHLYVATGQQTLLVTTDRYREVSYGDLVVFEGKIDVPKSFETDLGRTFNYPGYLHARDVSYVVSFAKMDVKEHGLGNPIITKLLKFKQAFMTHIEAVIPSPHVGLGEGLLLGVKQALGEDLETAFRKTGIMHVVVLSGYNIMLVVMFVTYLLAMFLPQRAQILFGATAVVLFALMVGLGATVLRASAMALLALLAKATGRTYLVVRALCLTGVGMLVFNPYLLVYDVGFQLSFIATLGLILVAPLLETYVGFMPTKLGLREFLTATIATQIFVTPILLYQIGEFSVVAIVVNMLVLPMVPVAMLFTFITGMIHFINATAALPFAYIAYLSLAYILGVAERFAQLPFASFSVPFFPFVVVIFAYGLFGFFLWRSYRKSNTTSDSHSVANWTIVEENTFIRELAEGRSPSASSSQPPPPSTPIFFR